MPTPLLQDQPIAQDDESQALLFRDDQIEAAVVAAEKQGRYTAGRLKAKQPAAYDAIVGLLGLAQPPGLAEIGRLFGVHHKTVAAVRDSNPEPIDIARSKRVARLLLAGDLQVDRLIESPDSAPMNVAGLIASQLYEKAELLAGRATQRVETPGRIDIQEQYRKLLASVQEKQLSADQVREIEPAGTGLVGKKTLPLEAPADGSAAAPSDTESDDHGPAAEVRPDDVTKGVTEHAPDAPAAPRTASAAAQGTPGGGSGLKDGDPSLSHQEPAKFSDNCSPDLSNP